MPFNFDRDTYLQVLADARATLKARGAEVVTTDEDPLKHDPRIEQIKNAPDIFHYVTREQLLNHNLAQALLHPPGRSKFFRRENPATLAMASLAAAALIRHDDIGVEPSGTAEEAAAGAVSTPAAATEVAAGTTPATPEVSAAEAAEATDDEDIIHLMIAVAVHRSDHEALLIKLLDAADVDTAEELDRFATSGLRPGDSLGGRFRTNLKTKFPGITDDELPPTDELKDLVDVTRIVVGANARGRRA